MWTQELRFSGGQDRFRWVAGGFYANTKRDYGQDLLVAGFQAATGIPTQGLAAPVDTLFYSRLGYKLDQFALFGEATLSVNDWFRAGTTIEAHLGPGHLTEHWCPSERRASSG